MTFPFCTMALKLKSSQNWLKTRHRTLQQNKVIPMAKKSQWTQRKIHCSSPPNSLLSHPWVCPPASQVADTSGVSFISNRVKAELALSERHRNTTSVLMCIINPPLFAASVWLTYLANATNRSCTADGRLGQLNDRTHFLFFIAPSGLF